MATQGILSVVRNGKVIVKVVAGSDGYHMPALAKIVREMKLSDVDSVYDEAEKLNIGSCGSLFVIERETFRTNSDDENELPAGYRKTFDDPKWNPRWDDGTAEYVEVVEL
jgi:hypothetical protein